VNILRSALLKGAIAAAMVGSTMAATVASAEVVCNRWHECWRVHDRVTYPANLGVMWHGDAWRRPGYHWRADHQDRGYYRRGVWIGF
jgi:hypothetical protein